MKRKAFSIVFLVMLIVGCKEGIITDAVTPEHPPKVEVTQGIITLENSSDGMARADLEYISNDRGNLAVNPEYYSTHDFVRGEVIYYKRPEIDKKKYPHLNPTEFSISRVIALPGETIQIKKGQIYINGKKLDTFYGKALSWGMDEIEYFDYMNKPDTNQCDEICQKEWHDYFNKNVDKITIPEGYMYIMGDTWWRSIDSQIFGALPIKNVMGKVLGYASEGNKEGKETPIKEELGETPPLPLIKAGDKAIQVYQSSYCWSSKTLNQCADNVGPEEMLKDKQKEQVKANAQITFKFDGKQPTEVTLTKFQNGTLTQEALTGDSFHAPQEKGIYYYSLTAMWLKDIEKRISEGDSSYVFVIEVIGD